MSDQPEKAGHTAGREWPMLTYLDLGEIIADEEGATEPGETLFTMPRADEQLGERVCLAFNCFDQMVAALRGAIPALERAHLPATPDSVDQLAREHLRARVAAFVRRRRV